MDGDGCKFGAVAAVQGIATPISVAKLVMKRSQHSILVGKGAQQFAKDHGVPVLSNELLQTENSIEAYKEFMRKKQKESHDCTAIGHDTIGVLVKDFQGNFAAGTSTSGMPFKSCGRVGDSPLPGAGLYADNEVGAAAASGDGDHILRFCPSFQVVQHMRNGMHPKEACKRVIMDIWRRVGENKMFEIALIAINSEGEVGMASTVNESANNFGPNPFPGFAYCLWNSEQKRSPRVLCEPPLVWSDFQNEKP
ncbi:uncharacterized protein LOC114524913 isoform X3 [Dendronephthya gigantea]|nr:uncharacterized protein LOC114524913 isoform X3 [Dendronephthya gigantea]